MDKEIGKLKREIGRAPRNERGRRRYGSDLRDRVVRAAKQWRAEGKALTKLGAELGIRDSLLSDWVRKAGDGSEQAVQRMRSVEVVEDAATVPGQVTMTLPGGAVIEGLCVDDIAILLKRS